jgi:hypothetical protein
MRQIPHWGIHRAKSKWAFFSAPQARETVGEILNWLREYAAVPTVLNGDAGDGNL